MLQPVITDPHQIAGEPASEQQYIMLLFVVYEYTAKLSTPKTSNASNASNDTRSPGNG